MTHPKRALVTGGAKRVGRAVVERLAEAGYHVAFTFNHSGEAAASLTRHSPGKVHPFHVDFADADALNRTVDAVRSRLGGLDVLVNCASLYVPDDTPAGATPALQRTLFAVNSVAPSWLMTRFAGDLTATNGSVVNFLDLLAEKPWPKYAAYCASKAALHAGTRAFARKLAPRVRVNGIAPGVIDWPDDLPEADRAAYLKRVPLARPGTPREAADLVLLLAEAMPYVTGQVLRLDGGRSLV